MAVSGNYGSELTVIVAFYMKEFLLTSIGSEQPV